MQLQNLATNPSLPYTALAYNAREKHARCQRNLSRFITCFNYSIIFIITNNSTKGKIYRQIGLLLNGDYRYIKAYCLLTFLKLGLKKEKKIPRLLNFFTIHYDVINRGCVLPFV